MKIKYDYSNPKCHDSSDGYIAIKNIQLDNEEFDKYHPYVIQWLDAQYNKTFINNKLFIDNLKAGTYSFRLYGNSISEWTTVHLSQPKPIKISSLLINNNSCETTASITIELDGGQPPYTINYGQHFVKSYSNNIIIDNISQPQNHLIKITDANNCSIFSDHQIQINFSKTIYDIAQISPPVIYDDHPQSFSLMVKNGQPPYRFVIYEAEEEVKKNILYDSQYLNIESQNDVYDLSTIIYPGSYIIDIVDSHGCVCTTKNINIPNSQPLEITVNSRNSYSAIDNTYLTPTEFIFDTILIPYNLIINNSTLKEWIKKLEIGSAINIDVGSAKYNQKIIRYNKHSNNYSSNIFDILSLDYNNDYWYFTINIGKGFNVTDSQIFAEMMFLKVDDEKFNLVPELNNDTNTCKLIRGNLLTSSLFTHRFQTSTEISVYDTKENSLIGYIPYLHTYNYYNTYQLGHIFAINFIDNPKYISQVNMDHPADFKISLQYNDLNNLKNILLAINNPNIDIGISTITTNNNGMISLWSPLSISDSNQYQIRYQKFDPASRKMLNIYENNKLANKPLLNELSPGLYLIRIIDKLGNKIKRINKQSYDEYYLSIKNNLYEIFKLNDIDINFLYGDIIVNILDDNNLIKEQTNVNSLGVENQKDHIYNNKTVCVSKDKTYQNSLVITSSSPVKCYISGPNNFIMDFMHNIELISLPPGVYNIIGDEDDLRQNYLLEQTYTAYMGQNNKEYIHVLFSSYKNKTIFK